MNASHKVSVGEVYTALSRMETSKARENISGHPLGDRTKRVFQLVLEDYMMEVPEELILKLCAFNLSMVEAAMNAKESDE